MVVAVAPVAAYADDVTVTGNYTVPKGTTIRGDLTVTDGYVYIDGTVEGNVTQHGSGKVSVFGVVEGNVVENGAGRVVVYGLVKGNVTERNDDDLEYFSVTSVAMGRSKERHPARTGLGEGGLQGVVEGNVVENDGGAVRVPGLVKGNVTEWNDGDLVVRGDQHRRGRRHRARQRPSTGEFGGWSRATPANGTAGQCWWTAGVRWWGAPSSGALAASP